MTGAQLVGLLVGMAIGAVVGAALGAVVLRTAISLYNRLAGGGGGPPRGVPELRFGEAMWIVVSISAVNALLTYIAFIILGAVIGTTGDGELKALVMAQAVSLPVALVVTAVLLASSLPTTLGRAALLTLCWSALVAATGAVVFAAYWLIVNGI